MHREWERRGSPVHPERPVPPRRVRAHQEQQCQEQRQRHPVQAPQHPEQQVPPAPWLPEPEPELELERLALPDR